MKGLFWLLASAALASLVALSLTDFQGNVVFLVPPWRVDMSLAAFGFASLALFLLLYAALQVARRVLRIPSLAAAYRERSKRARARSALAKSVVDLSAGRFSRALQGAQIALSDDTLQSAARLIAAQAAHKLNDSDKRDSFLQPLLSDAKPELREAAELTLAQAALDDHDPTRAAETLARMTGGPARRVHALRLKLQAARLNGDAPEVLRIAHLLEKHHDMSAEVATALGEQAALLLLAAARHDVERLGLAFMRLDSRWRHCPKVAIEAARLFADHQALPRARAALLDAISAISGNRDAPTHELHLSALYAALSEHTKGIDAAFLQKLETWRKAAPKDAGLALLAGRACVQLELWGKARQFLVEAVSLAAAADAVNSSYARAALVTHAKLEEQLGEAAKAAELYKKAALR